MTQALWIGRVMQIACEVFVSRSNLFNPPKVPTQSSPARSSRTAYHLIVAQRLRIGRIVLVTGKLPCLTVERIQPPSPGTDPERTCPVFNDPHNGIFTRL